MPDKVRVRFAPSPTGPLHIGGVRTALFNYLFAKKNNGVFVLRIEDTDRNRFVDGAEDYIIKSLDWCTIPFDEGPGKEGGYGPYRQSERRYLYKTHVQKLIESGDAYYAFDTPEELDSFRKAAEGEGKAFIYNWHNRDQLKNSLVLSETEVQNLIESGVPYVIRFKSPQDQEIVLNDQIRGEITIDTNTLDDKILFKADGMPTYHLANVVDDHLMKISHVIRGEEWLPSLALHCLLYRAFNWDPPVFAHLPLILKPEGKGKLSKRDSDKMGFPIFPLSWGDSKGYKEAGYYPEAVVNFLVMLGWNPGTEQEIFSLQELAEQFSIERVHKGGARFDPEKTKWYNHHYLQQQPDRLLLTDLKKNIEYNFNKHSESYLIRVIQLLKERLTFVNDIWEEGDFFFQEPESYNEKAVKKHWKEDTSGIMTQFSKILENTDDFTSTNLENRTKSWIEDQGLGFGKVMAPLRLAIVGDLKGPHLYDIMELLGKEMCLNRISKAVNVLS